MFSFLFSAFTASIESNGIFKKVYNDKIIVLDASGSSKQNINGSAQYTKPEYAVDPVDKRYDWCSNCLKNYEEHPWITFSLKSRKFKINGYFVRCGCCYDGCCCVDEGYGCVYCCLYSWSLQISDDNKTWTDVHRVEKDYEMRFCKEKTYKLDKEYVAKYVRLIQNQPCPGDPPCISLNKIEFFGDVVPDGNIPEDEIMASSDDDSDDVSIIGHITRNNAFDR